MFLNGRKASNLDQINILNRKHEMFLNDIEQYVLNEEVNLTVNMKCF